MAQWKVVGAYLDTGKNFSKTIEAENYADVQAKLKEMKACVESVTELAGAEPITRETTLRPLLKAPTTPWSLRDQFNAAIGLMTAVIAGVLVWQAVMIPKWEYRIESPGDLSLTTRLDSLGAEGWELVTARRASNDFDRVSYEMIFNRPKR